MSGARDWGCRCTPLCACFPALTSLGDEGPFTPTVHTLTLAPHPPVSTWTHARVHVTCIAHMPSYSHPPAPTRPPAHRRPRPTASASWESSAPAPCALMSWWWLEIGRRGSIYTTGTGKFLHSRLHPPHKHLHPSVHTCPPLRLYKSTRPHTYLGPQVLTDSLPGAPSRHPRRPHAHRPRHTRVPITRHSSDADAHPAPLSASRAPARMGLCSPRAPARSDAYCPHSLSLSL